MNDTTGDKFLRPEFGEFKEDLLNILHKARRSSDLELKGSKKADKDWRDAVWCNIETTAKAFLSREAEKPSSSDRQSVEDRLDSIAKAFQWANILIDRELPDRALIRNGFGPGYNSLLKAWHLGERDKALKNNREVPPIGEVEIRFMKALEAVAILERAATLAAEKRPKKRGRPLEHLCDVVVGLAHVYEHATGEKAGKGDGPFARFVNIFLVAIDYARSDIPKLIKTSLSKMNTN
jgi:hypothetical protein